MFSRFKKTLTRKNREAKPSRNLYETLTREHGSAEHGYLIKAVEEIVKKVYKFEKTTTGRSENRIPLRNGMGCIPDIIGYGLNKKVFIEVECGTHNYVDFCEKCNRLMRRIPFKVNYSHKLRSFTNSIDTATAVSRFCPIM